MDIICYQNCTRLDLKYNEIEIGKIELSQGHSLSYHYAPG